MRVYPFILLCVSTFFTVNTMASEPMSAKERRVQQRTEQATTVEAAVNARDFRIEVNRVSPSSGRSFAVSPYYDITIKGDSLYSSLPYFGRAYSLPYGGGEGLRFEAVMTNYKMDVGRKGDMTVHFDVRSRDDSYRYTVNIFSNGNSMIYVQPNNRQSITFNGQMVFKEQKK